MSLTYIKQFFCIIGFIHFKTSNKKLYVKQRSLRDLVKTLFYVYAKLLKCLSQFAARKSYSAPFENTCMSFSSFVVNFESLDSFEGYIYISVICYC